MARLKLPTKQGILRDFTFDINTLYTTIDNTWTRISGPLDYIFCINGFLPGYDNRAKKLVKLIEKRSGMSIQGVFAYWENYSRKYYIYLEKEGRNPNSNRLNMWRFFKKLNLTKKSGRKKRSAGATTQA